MVSDCEAQPQIQIYKYYKDSKTNIFELSSMFFDKSLMIY